MNSRQLIFEALRNNPIPRMPSGPLAVHFCARKDGVSMVDYSTNAASLADSVIAYHRRFQPDAVWISADTWVSAEAVGVPLVYSGTTSPPSGNGKPFISIDQDPGSLIVPDPELDGRVSMIRDALIKVRQILGNEVFIVGCFDQSPFSLACQLAGTEEMMLSLYSSPLWAKELLDFCSQVAIQYGTILARAGADMLSTGDSPAGLIGQDLYRTFALPAEQRVFAELRRITDSILSLHICGDATTILEDMCQSGADVLEIDHQIPIQYALQHVPPTITLWGNLDPVKVLLQGSTKIIADEIAKIREAVIKDGRYSFILSSGCTLAPDTPDDHIYPMMDYELIRRNF